MEPLQDFIDQYQDLTAEEWNALDPPPDIEPMQNAMVEAAQEAVGRGCDADATEEALQEAIGQLSGRGEVGAAIAAALRGEGPLLGPPGPAPTTTVAPESEPSTVTIAVGDSLPDVLDRVAPGSTIEFAPGVHRFVEPIIVDKELTFVGAGLASTTLSSSAEGVALAFVGPGGFAMSKLTVEHTGTAEASVFLAIEGPVTLDDVRIRGAVAGGEESGGGHGVVFAYEPLPGFPERTPAQRAGPLTITNSTIIGNDSAGVLITGGAAPRITGTTISRSGGCGLCYTGTATGSVADSKLVANAIGVQVDGTAEPVLRENTISLSGQVAVTIGEEAKPFLVSNVIEDNGDIGIQVTGSAAPFIEKNTIRRHGVGVLGGESAKLAVRENLLSDHEVGIQFGGEVVGTATRNVLTSSAVAGISYGGSSTGVAEGNDVRTAAEVALQVVDQAAPELRANIVSSPGAVGISVLGTARATVVDNQVRDRDVGIQLGGASDTIVRANTVTASTAVGILFGDQAVGLASGNTVTASAGVGILLGGTSAARVERNTIADNGIGMVFREDARGTAFENTIERHVVGMQVVDRSATTITGNKVFESVEAGVVFGGSTTATFDVNTVARNGSIAVQIGESANPTVARNEIRGQGVYGILLRDTARGTITSNQIADHVFGIQLGDAAAPAILDNTLTEIALTNIVYADNTAGRIAGNKCSESLSAGISITAPANPDVGENQCSVSRSAG